MALLKPSLDYTDKDFDALRARMFNLISGVFPQWTSTDVADFGNILVELWCWAGDVLLYYQDNQANEAFIPTATLRRSLLAAAKRLGFRPRGQSAAIAQLTASLAAPPLNDVTINAGDTFRTERVTTPITFQALTSAVIPAGANPPSVMFDVEHSENETETFQSTTRPNQVVVLSSTPFLDGSLTVTAADGAYTIVDDFLESISTDRHVTVTVDQNDRATLRFGNGVQGTIPQGAIDCSYKTGGGVEGNVEPGTIRRPERGYVDALNNTVILTVTNPEAANGGLARQTVESIRVEAPRSLRALTRSVAREDYEIHVKKLGGVARVLFLTSDEYDHVAENEGHLYIVPGGGGLPSPTLKAQALAQITTVYPRSPSFRVRVFDPQYLTINVQAKVFPRFGAGTVAQNAVLNASIRSALAAFFALDASDGSENPTAQFGYYLDDVIAYSDIFNAVRDVRDVRRIGDDPPDLLVNGGTDDIEVAPYVFPALGTVTLINGFTGQPLAA